MYLAFREVDIPQYYETYVFVLVAVGTVLWILSSIIQWLWTCRDAKGKQEHRNLVLLKDDLIKAGPYKRDRGGIPVNDCMVKLHAVIYKHSQKKIIEKEMEY